MDYTQPVIKVGNGSSKFYANLCRSYMKNHDFINVIAGGYKINVALEIYLMLSEEYLVGNLQHFCIKYDRMHTMCLFSIASAPPYPLQTVGDTMWKINDNQSVASISKEITLKNISSLSASGKNTVKLFFVASQIWLQGWYVKKINVYKQLEDTLHVEMHLYKHTY